MADLIFSAAFALCSYGKTKELFSICVFYHYAENMAFDGLSLLKSDGKKWFNPHPHLESMGGELDDTLSANFY